MELNLEPVKVDLQIETPSLERGAFYSLCFITENDKAPRTLKVERLKDLLDNGYDRSSLAYNFCVGVFAQQGIPFVYVRAKRAAESYEEAFSADDNSNYYFVVIESKDLHEISNFNQYLSSVDENKLQFYSNSSHEVSEISKGKVVKYYQEFFDFSGEENYYLNKAYKTVTSHNYSSKPYPVLLDEDDYHPRVIPLNITLRQLLKDATIESDAYQPIVSPLDIELRSILNSRYINENEIYAPLVKPLNITIRPLLTSKSMDSGAYQPSVKPLNIAIRRVLIEMTVDEKDIYIPSAKPLDITLKKGA